MALGSVINALTKNKQNLPSTKTVVPSKNTSTSKNTSGSDWKSGTYSTTNTKELGKSTSNAGKSFTLDNGYTRTYNKEGTSYADYDSKGRQMGGGLTGTESWKAPSKIGSGSGGGSSSSSKNNNSFNNNTIDLSKYLNDFLSSFQQNNQLQQQTMFNNYNDMFTNMVNQLSTSQSEQNKAFQDSLSSLTGQLSTQNEYQMSALQNMMQQNQNGDGVYMFGQDANFQTQPQNVNMGESYQSALQRYLAQILANQQGGM